MRVRAILITCLALAAIPSASLALSLPFGLDGLSSYGFPIFSRLSPYLQPSASYSGPESLFSFANDFRPVNLSSMPGLTPYSPGASSFGFPALSGPGGFSGPSSFTQLGIPGMGQSFPDLKSIVDESLPGYNTYKEDSNGRTIKMKLGDTVRVQLDSRLDQGFIWNLSVTDGLNVTGNRIYTPDQPLLNFNQGTVEILSTQEWDINAIKPGTQVINATCSRSTPGPGDKAFILTVIVE